MSSEGEQITAHICNAPDVKVNLWEGFEGDCPFSGELLGRAAEENHFSDIEARDNSAIETYCVCQECSFRVLLHEEDSDRHKHKSNKVYHNGK